METPMKHVPVAALAALLFIFFCPFQPSAFAGTDLFYEAGFLAPKQKIKAPDFTLEDVDGHRVSLTDFRGKTVLLYFWATW